MTNSLFDLRGKSILVTGGNGGIGLGMAAIAAFKIEKIFDF